MNLLPWSALLAVSTSSVYLAQRCRQAALTIRRLVSEHLDLRQELAGQHAVSGAAELRYKLLFNDVSAPIIITRYSGDIVTANAAFVRMLGYESEAELRTHNAAEFYVDPGVREAEMRHLSMEPHNHNREFPLKRKDGSLIKVVVTGRVLPLENGNEPLIEGIFTDITALRLVEERCGQLEHGLRTSQKLRSIGSLAAGVAHEINTPLQYISDSVHVLMTRVHELLEIARTEDSANSRGACRPARGTDRPGSGAHGRRHRQRYAYRARHEGILAPGQGG